MKRVEMDGDVLVFRVKVRGAEAGEREAEGRRGMRLVTVVYKVVDETEWGATNPLRYEHNGLQAVRLGAGDALDARDALHDIMPFVEDVYWAHLATPEYRAAVEHARACLECRQRKDGSK